MTDRNPTERAYHAAFRARLKGIRDDLGWSQADMAKAIGISLENYKKYEVRSKFPPHLLDQLARVTHRPLEFVVTGQGPNIRVIRSRATR